MPPPDVGRPVRPRRQPPGRAEADLLRRWPDDLPLSAGAAGWSGGSAAVLPIWPGGGRRPFEAPPRSGRGPRSTQAPSFASFRDRAAAPAGRARPIGSGLAYFALRTGARDRPTHPGRHHELYRRRRLPAGGSSEPVTWQASAGRPPDDAPRPDRGRRRSGGWRTQVGLALPGGPPGRSAPRTWRRPPARASGSAGAG